MNLCWEICLVSESEACACDCALPNGLFGSEQPTPTKKHLVFIFYEKYPLFLKWKDYLCVRRDR